MWGTTGTGESGRGLTEIGDEPLTWLRYQSPALPEFLRNAGWPRLQFDVLWGRKGQETGLTIARRTRPVGSGATRLTELSTDGVAPAT